MILQGGVYPSIALYDMFAEGYTSMLHSSGWRPGFARCHTVIDFYHLDDELKGFVTIDASKLVEAYPNVEPNQGYLCIATGTPSDHLTLFVEFAHACEDGPRGADDDTFDYWPGAMDTLEDYAMDLKELGNDSVTAVLRSIARRNKAVSEWEENAERLINLK